MLNHINYILLDAARIGDHISDAKKHNKIHDSLYRGNSEIALAALAPYIFQFRHPTPFSEWYLEKGWGNAWGILLKSARSMPELHKHFRKFLILKTDEGKQLYFRFYDPRVLRIALPICEPDQIYEFFGPVEYFVVEDEDPAFALLLRHENGILKQQRFKMQDVAPEFASLSAKSNKPDETLPDKVIAITDIAQSTNLPTSESAVNAQPVNAKLRSKWHMFD